jgi:hypothetical protein
MHTAAEYREYAQECMESARSATSDDVRTQFLELAKLWLAAATQLELRKGDGATIWPAIDQPPQDSLDSS